MHKRRRPQCSGFVEDGVPCVDPVDDDHVAGIRVRLPPAGGCTERASSAKPRSRGCLGGTLQPTVNHRGGTSLRGLIEQVAPLDVG